AWGESLFLLLQTLTLLFLILHFGGRTGRGLALVAVFGAFVGILVSPVTPLSFVTALQALNLPIIILSRVRGARQGHTGQLSGVSTGLLFGGALARIFTSLTETGDLLLASTFAASATCNGVLLAQVLLLGGSRDPHPKKG
ncbi:mannose-P-dolichol utilization defect 1 protein, partial [Geospiza fortis]|uniref:Mannose-P-dolichol utilization defect 1 protein n=1 Tax=Geospiza fortis TaxID=48883 RepID=A0A8N5F1H2_GEOFO